MYRLSVYLFLREWNNELYKEFEAVLYTKKRMYVTAKQRDKSLVNTI